MAPKKKKAKMPEDKDVTKAKAKLGEDARAVGKAAESLLRKPVSVPLDVDKYGSTWDQTVGDVDDLDKEFGEDEVIQKENFVDFLRSKLRKGETEVRVMQVSPTGRFIDVSDKLRLGDLKPEDIGGVETDSGRTLGMGRNRQTREEARRMLQELMASTQTNRGDSSKSESVRRMEKTLEESDKILKHWKE